VAGNAHFRRKPPILRFIGNAYGLATARRWLSPALQYIFLKKFSFWVEGFWISCLLISREVVSPE
ncbi:MAG: hypothetical protein ACI3V3_01820, partial [Faecousia sp.]